jgi:hypothetical protein
MGFVICNKTMLADMTGIAMPSKGRAGGRRRAGNVPDHVGIVMARSHGQDQKNARLLRKML